MILLTVQKLPIITLHLGLILKTFLEITDVMSVVFDIRMIEGMLLFSSTDSFRPPPPWRSTPKHSRSALVLRTLASQTSHLRGQKLREFFFFSNETCWRVFGFKRKHMHMYVHICIHMNHMNIKRKSGDDFWNFLRSCCLSEVKVIPITK